jgi:hypothetical protein
MAAWIPQSFDDACKRNAGRRKLHRRKRHARADRIVALLGAMDATAATELLTASRGWVTAFSLAMQTSKATASRDLGLVRRIHQQFTRMFGRTFNAKMDRIVWVWNWDYYGFITPESKLAGYPKPVGHFPFDTRKQESEESYCGFNQLSWQNGAFISQMSTRDLIRSLGWSVNRLSRLRN